MISYIKGELSDISDDNIVLETFGIGYEIRVPLSVLNMLPGIGNDVKIYTYQYVREDTLDLYGFLTKDDLSVFKLLITVNGIGPKAALGVLSTLTSDDLRFAVLSNDVKSICKAPGIGTKTASKLILELKDKLKLEDAFEQKLENSTNASLSNENGMEAKNDALKALVALGYNSSDALKAIRQVEITNDMDTETILKLSLKKISIF